MGQTEELLAHGGKPIGVLVPHPGVAASHKSSWSWGAEAPGLNPSPHFSLLPSPGSHCFPLCVSESVLRSSRQGNHAVGVLLTWCPGFRVCPPGSCV